MDKIKEMGEGIKVQDPPVHKTTKDEFTARGKRSASAGKQCTCLTFHLHRLTTCYLSAKNKHCVLRSKRDPVTRTCDHGHI